MNRTWSSVSPPWLAAPPPGPRGPPRPTGGAPRPLREPVAPLQIDRSEPPPAPNQPAESGSHRLDRRAHRLSQPLPARLVPLAFAKPPRSPLHFGYQNVLSRRGEVGPPVRRHPDRGERPLRSSPVLGVVGRPLPPLERGRA